MSDQEKSAQTRAPDEAKTQESGLSDLLRVGSDANSMLLGSTPLESEGSDKEAGEKKASADSAGDPTASAAAIADPAAAAAEPAPEAGSPESDHAAAKRVAARSRPVGGGAAVVVVPEKAGFAGSQAAGLALAAVGVLLLALPFVIPQLPLGLERVLDSRLSSGILIVGGLLLFLFGALRRTMWNLQGSMDAVGAETARLEGIAVDAHDVLKALHTVRIENTTLAEDVTKLQVKIKRLTEIVSNPDYAGSIFRLAASVDMLGKHVEVYMKEQFGTLEKRWATIAQQSEHAEHQLKALGQVHGLMKEQLRVQQLSVQQGFDHLNSASVLTSGRIEQNLQTAARIEATIKSQQETLSTGWVSLSDRLSLSVGQVAKDLNDLRSSFDRQILSQTESLQLEFQELDSRIGLAERNQATGIQQLSDQVQAQLARGIEELQQSQKQLADLTSREHQELDSRIGVSERNQSSGIQKLSDQVQAELALRIEELKQSQKQLADLTSRSQQEVAGGFGELGARFDKHSREQQASLQQVRERATEATKAAKGELAAILDQLRVHLEQLARDHMAALHQSTLDSQKTAGAVQSELASSADKIGSRIENALEARSRNLSSDLMEVADRVQSITTEIRSCVAESILRAASSRSDTGGSTDTAGERPRVEFVSPSAEAAGPDADGLVTESISRDLDSLAPETARPELDGLAAESSSEPPVQDESSPPPEIPNP
jgi:hypothetical protein